MSGYKYFMYSLSYVQEKNAIEKKFGREFVPGIVTTGNSRSEFCIISDFPEMEGYTDSRVVAQGVIENMRYVKPSTVLLVRGMS